MTVDESIFLVDVSKCRMNSHFLLYISFVFQRHCHFPRCDDPALWLPVHQDLKHCFNYLRNIVSDTYMFLQSSMRPCIKFVEICPDLLWQDMRAGGMWRGGMKVTVSSLSNSSSSNEMKTCEPHDWPKQSQARADGWGLHHARSDSGTWEAEREEERRGTQTGSHSPAPGIWPQNARENWPIQHWTRQLNNVMDTFDLPLYEPRTPWHDIKPQSQA